MSMIQIFLFVTLLYTAVSFQIQSTLGLKTQIKSKYNAEMTHLQYVDSYGFAKNGELNRTFTLLNQKFQSLPSLELAKTVNNVTYNIFDVKVTFRARDTNNNAVFFGDESVVIQQSFAQIVVYFSWTKNGGHSQNGTGRAFGLSDEVVYAKQLRFNNLGYLYFQLLDYFDIIFSKDFQIKITPQKILKDDKNQIQKMINNKKSEQLTLKIQIEKQIKKYYKNFLTLCLDPNTPPNEQYFNYTWLSSIASKNDLMINFTRYLWSFDMNKNSFSFGHYIKIDNFTNSRSNSKLSQIQLPNQTYGGSQSFVSYVFYQDVLKYAAQKGQFDTQLNKRFWQSRIFKFSAGDLYEIFPILPEIFEDDVKVTGSCKTDHNQLFVQNLSVQKENDCFNVRLKTKCQLNIHKTNIFNFIIDLNLTVQGQPKFGSIDFILKRHSQKVTFNENKDFKMTNLKLAREMISLSVDRLFDSKLFGSGWPVPQFRNHPKFEALATWTIIYDPTIIENEEL